MKQCLLLLFLFKNRGLIADIFGSSDEEGEEFEVRGRKNCCRGYHRSQTDTSDVKRFFLIFVKIFGMKIMYCYICSEKDHNVIPIHEDKNWSLY